MMNTAAIKRLPEGREVGSGGVTAEGFLEIVPDRVYWMSTNAVPRSSPTHHFFSIDNELVYEPFFADFGPLNLGCTYRYCKLMQALLDDPELGSKKIVHLTSICPKKRANAAYLICAFQVMILNRRADTAYKPFASIRPPFLPFRDATCGPCPYQCTVLDCIKGLEYAMSIKWFAPETFDVAAYEYYEKVEHGDLNWVVPDKFLAFTGPSATPICADGYPAFTPEDYVPIFKSGGITLVVRLNKKQYDRRRFMDHGLKHVDLYFLDGSCPPRDIINKWLYIVENEPGAVAVHCKAGLGRTGTLIALWAQKHFQFPGRAWVGWNRICRPGAILGPQQQFLSEMQHEMFQAGAAARARLTNQPHQSANFAAANGGQRGGLSAEQAAEDLGQGERLTGAKRGLQLGQGQMLGSQQLGGLNANNSDFKLVGGTSSLTVMPQRFGTHFAAQSSKPLRGMFGPQPAIG